MNEWIRGHDPPPIERVSVPRLVTGEPPGQVQVRCGRHADPAQLWHQLCKCESNDPGLRHKYSSINLVRGQQIGIYNYRQGVSFQCWVSVIVSPGNIHLTTRLQWQGHLLPSQWRTTDMLKLSPRTDLKWWTSIIIGANWVNVLKEIYRNGEKKYRVDQVVRNKHVTRLNCSRSSVRSN